MKYKRTIALFAAATMLVSCGKSTENETSATSETTAVTSEETTETTTESSVETTTEATTEATTEVTTEATTDESTVETTEETTEVTAVETSGSVTYITSEGKEYKDYYVTDFSIAGDGATGHFVVEEFAAYTEEEVMAFEKGGTLPGGGVIKSLTVSENGDSVCVIDESDCMLDYTRMENGKYYMISEFGFAASEPAGELDLKIAPDVIIVDNVSPYNTNGIRVDDITTVYGSLSEFTDKLDDEAVWYIPDLYIRVVDDQVILISINPGQHQPWGDF